MGSSASRASKCNFAVKKEEEKESQHLSSNSLNTSKYQYHFEDPKIYETTVKVAESINRHLHQAKAEIFKDSIDISSSSEEGVQEQVKNLQHQHRYHQSLRRQLYHVDHTNKEKYESKRKKQPIIEISSSSSSSSSSVSSVSDNNEPENASHSQYQDSRTTSSSCCFSCYDNDEDKTVANKGEEEEVVDWLEQTTSTIAYKDSWDNDKTFTIKPRHYKRGTKKTPDHSLSSPLMPTKASGKMTFTPPGWDSPLHDNGYFPAHNKSSMGEGRAMSLSVKDTFKVKRKNAELPSRKPDATKGNWLTNRVVINNYIILHCLGNGSYGEVRLCKERNSNKLYAVKVINRPRTYQFATASTNDLKMEVSIMKKLRHVNCVRLYEVMDDPSQNTIYLILEYMERGDLMHILDNTPVEDNDVWDIMRQVIRGLKYLHDNNIIHGDLKPQNLLVASDGTVKIADFGLSKMIDDEGEMQKDFVGTPAFFPPEICSGLPFDAKVADLYSVGATIFCVRFGKPPFVGKNLSELYLNIQNNPVHFPFPVARGLQDIIEGLMLKIPSRRLTMTQLMLDPWLQYRPGETKITSQLLQVYDRVQVSSDAVYNSFQSLSRG